MAQAALSTTAWVAHDLGVATALGGSVFGHLALHPAMRNISDADERAQVIADSWRRFNRLRIAGLGLAGATWLVGRMWLSGRELGKATRGLVLAKDILLPVALLSAAGAATAGNRLEQEDAEVSMPGQARGTKVGRARRLKQTVRAMSFINLACDLAVLGLTTVLAMRAGRSLRFAGVGRTLR